MAKEKKLKRGLDEIFGSDIDSFLDDISNNSTEYKGTSKSELNISEIRPNPYQPRKEFDEAGLNELADSIRMNGVFQPILVRQSLSGYELVAGERRLRASKLAGKKTIPAIIVDFNDQQMMEISLLENIQRKDLTPIEEASAYDQLIRKLNYTQDELAKRIGKSRTNVTNMLRLLNLPDEIKKMVNEGKLSYGHARTLLSLESEEKMIALAEKTIKEGLSVRQLEDLCKKKDTKKPAKDKPEETDPFMEDVRNRLQRKYGTKVEIKNKCISIRYNDIDDLNRILEIMNVIED
ncbi:MAG: ParB/RepB/Spo0J family partition protein [Erysipelotrichaceae bacterium]|nr:ParB/RepB/Spo0J family partition protein [Erysipelotrichaceae bacterium]